MQRQHALRSFKVGISMEWQCPGWWRANVRNQSTTNAGVTCSPKRSWPGFAFTGSNIWNSVAVLLIFRYAAVGRPVAFVHLRGLLTLTSATAADDAEGLRHIKESIQLKEKFTQILEFALNTDSETIAIKIAAILSKMAEVVFWKFLFFFNQKLWDFSCSDVQVNAPKTPQKVKKWRQFFSY